jgi:peptidoglycan/xylan/chitin deacetylase (PgdA/CDA1 family)
MKGCMYTPQGLRAFYRRFLVLTLFSLLFTIPGRGSDESEGNSEAVYNERTLAKVFGVVSISYDSHIPAGGTVSIGTMQSLITEDGFFELKGLLPQMYLAEVVFNNQRVVSQAVELYEGVNQVNFNIKRVIPSFMVKQITEDMSPEEIFSPVAQKVFSHGNKKLKRIAITVDDGWARDYPLLELLKTYGIRCTVFIIAGRGIGNKHPEWIRMMDEMGFEVCSHTWDHTPITKRSNKTLAEDLRKSQMVFSNVTHKKYPYFRPPFGLYDDRTLKIVAENGYYIIHWSNSIHDTVKGITVEKQVDSVMKKLTNGDIILSHFGAYNTYKVFKIIIPKILEKGYEFATVSEVLEGVMCE